MKILNVVCDAGTDYNAKWFNKKHRITKVAFESSSEAACFIVFLSEGL